jgi:RNA polymerase sigma-70 factor (ECF subfamily)
MPDQVRADDAQERDNMPDDARWAEWMLRAQDGDRSSYHALLQAVTPYVRTITRRYLGRCEDAEDALQDVLMIVHGIRHTYERGRPFKPWLSTIASRRCIDLLRRRSHRLQHETDAEIDTEAHPHIEHGPEETFARHHTANTLRDAVAELPERQREAIQLLRFKELSLNEAAEQSTQSVGSLKVACHRAMKSLQRALGKKDSSHD